MPLLGMVFIQEFSGLNMKLGVFVVVGLIKEPP
jgi:hypothetical protein